MVNIQIPASLYPQQSVQASCQYRTQKRSNTWQVAAAEYYSILTEVSVSNFQGYNRMHLHVHMYNIHVYTMSILIATDYSGFVAIYRLLDCSFLLFVIQPSLASCSKL